MNDVAREAGVALKTVSRFVNGETNINPQMAARIAAAIGKLGYRRNLAAASIRPGWTSRILGLVISDLANPFYSGLTRAIEATARERGYLLISASSEEDGSIHDAIIDRLMEQRVDGLIVVPPLVPGRSWADIPPPIPPLVVLDRPIDAPHCDTILADNRAGAREATAQLLAGAARRVAFVGDNLQLNTIRERLDGYREALAANGIEVDQSLIVESAHDADQAAQVVAQLMDDAAPDAIFAANNRSAVGALRVFAQTGRRLPLIAFDDFEAASLGIPQVSVVAQDIEQMGRLAATWAIDRKNGDTSPPRTQVLPTSLVLRGSEKR